MNYPLAPHLHRFFSCYLAVQKGLSSNTILTYRDAIKLLLCFVADRMKKTVDELSLEDLDEERVLAFLDHLENERGCSIRTRNARLAAVRAFFAFIGREEPALLEQVQKIRAIPLKRCQHKTIDYADEDEMRAMLDSVDINAANGIRDKALLLMLYNTGARASEIGEIKTTDLRLDEQGQVTLLGKGKKPRMCPLWPETVKAVTAYLAVRDAKDCAEQHLFLNAKRTALTRFGLRHITRKYAAVAQEKCASLGDKVVGPHTFRHSTAMHLLRADNDINTISYWLGHADVNTTHVYVEIDMEMKRRMLEKAPAPHLKKTPLWQKSSVLKWLDNLSRSPELCAVNT